MQIRTAPTNFIRQIPTAPPRQNTNNPYHFFSNQARGSSPNPQNNHQSPPVTRITYQSPPPQKVTSEYMMHLIPQTHRQQVLPTSQPMSTYQGIPHSSQIRQFIEKNSSVISDDKSQKGLSQVKPNAIVTTSKPLQIGRSRVSSCASQQAAQNRKHVNEVHNMEYRQPLPPNSILKNQQVSRKMGQYKVNQSQLSENRSIRSISQQNMHITIQMEQDSPPPIITVKQPTKGSVMLPQIIKQQNNSEYSQISMQNRPKIISNYSTNSQAKVIVNRIENNVSTIVPKERMISFQQNSLHSSNPNPIITQNLQTFHPQPHQQIEETPKKQIIQISPYDQINQQNYGTQAYYTNHIQKFNTKQFTASSTSKPQSQRTTSKPQSQRTTSKPQGKRYPQETSPQEQYYRQPYYEYYNPQEESEFYEEDNKSRRKSGISEYVTEHLFSNSRRLVNQIFQNETNRALLKLKSLERRERSKRKYRY